MIAERSEVSNQLWFETAYQPVKSESDARNHRIPGLTRLSRQRLTAGLASTVPQVAARLDIRIREIPSLAWKLNACYSNSCRF